MRITNLYLGPFVKFTIILSILLATSSLLSQNIELKVEQDKGTYLVGEGIYSIVTLINLRSNEFIYSQFYIGGLLKLIVENERGTIMPCNAPIFEYGSKPMVKRLNTIDSLKEVIRVDRYYPSTVDGKHPFPFPTLFRMEPGKYKLQATFQFDSVLLRSNKVEFRILAPTGDEKTAYEELHRIFSEIYLSKNKGKKVDEFKTFVQNFKSSHYLPLAHKYLGVSYKEVGNLWQSNETMKNLIERFPNTGYALEALNTLEMPKNEKKMFLQKIVKEHSTDYLGKHAKYFLGKLMHEN